MDKQTIMLIIYGVVILLGLCCAIWNTKKEIIVKTIWNGKKKLIK